MEWAGLIELLGKENSDKIKDVVTEEIIDNLRESIRNQWVCMPLEFTEAFEEIESEVLESVKKKYKKELKGIMEEEMVAFIEQAKEKSITMEKKEQ